MIRKAPTSLELARWLDPEVIVSLMSDEHPQAIAVLLLQLDPQVAAQVLAGSDPIIPARDLQDIARSAQLQIATVPHGGHCGFMESLGRESWADRRVAEYMGLLR